MQEAGSAAQAGGEGREGHGTELARQGKYKQADNPGRSRQKGVREEARG